MKEIIDEAAFEELAQTGKIGMTPEEAVSLREEMNRQMAVIRLLGTIPLDPELRPVIHGNPYPADIRCGLREDVPHPFPGSEDICQQAPETGDGCIISPGIHHQRIG